MNMATKCSFLVYLILISLTSSCAHGSPQITSYELFNSKFERVPDLVNSSAAAFSANPELIDEALRDGLKNGKILDFVRMVRGSTYLYYVFQVQGLEDGYVSYAVKHGKLLYSFVYSGEANPQF